MMEKVAAYVVNIGRKVVRANMQLEYLELCKQEGGIPTGIASQMKFTTSIHDNELAENCLKIMNQSASRILDYMILYYKERAKKLTTYLYGEKEKVFKTINDEKRRIAETNIREAMVKEKISIKKIHEKKIEKCKQHFKIYIPIEQDIIQTIQIYNGKEKRKKRKSNKKTRKHRDTKAKHERNQIK